MVIFIYGEDTFRSRMYLKEQVQKFKKTRDPAGYNTVFLDGKQETIGKILGEILATPFLAEKRMIVVQNILSSSDKELISELILRLKEQKIPESNVVLFWQGELLSKIKETKELYELLRAEKYAQEFNSLKGVNLVSWIKQEIDKRGVKIDSEAIQYLVNHAGKDMWLLSSLIDQLVAYKKDAEISSKDVQLFVSETTTETVFALVDAIINGNHKQAFLLLKEHELAEDTNHLFGLLIWQMRILLEMRDCFEREEQTTAEQMAKKIGLHPFVVKKNLAFIKRTSLTNLKKIYQELLDIDIKTKTGFGNQEILLDVFVASR